MKIVGVIPVRYGSKRFPGKALAMLWGKPVIQHVYEHAVSSGALDSVIIATDDDRIKDVAERFAEKVVMTPSQLPSGSDRAAYAVSNIDCDIVINIQADQPVFPVNILKELIDPMRQETDIQMTTPVVPLADPESINNANTVKAVLDKNGFAVYFSRAPIPYLRNKENNENVFYKHIGIYAYKKKFLMEYSRMSPLILEKTEGLEQLRILEYGYKIMTVITVENSPSIDTPEDLENLESKGSSEAHPV